MKRKLLMLGLAVGAAAFLAFVPEATASASVNTAPAVAEGISVELGQRDFRNYCAACHGIDGIGDGTMAEFLTLKVPDLTKLTKRSYGTFPLDRVMRVIDGRADVRIHGARDMPVWGDWFNREALDPKVGEKAREEIVGDRIESLVAFLKSIQSN